MSDSNSTRPGLTTDATFLLPAFSFDESAANTTPVAATAFASLESAARFNMRFLQETMD